MLHVVIIRTRRFVYLAIGWVPDLFRDFPLPDQAVINHLTTTTKGH